LRLSYIIISSLGLYVGRKMCVIKGFHLQSNCTKTSFGSRALPGPAQSPRELSVLLHLDFGGREYVGTGQGIGKRIELEGREGEEKIKEISEGLRLISLTRYVTSYVSFNHTITLDFRF